MAATVRQAARHFKAQHATLLPLTGPNTSSFQMRMEGVTSTSTVGA